MISDVRPLTSVLRPLVSGQDDFSGFYELTNYRVFSSTNEPISWIGLGRTKGKQSMELAQLQAVSAALIIK